MNEENIKSEDYIHLPPLKKICIQFLRFIFLLVDEVLEVFWKFKFLIIVGFIIGSIFGFYLHSSSSNYYEVSMIAESSSLQKRTVSEMVNSLNDLIKTNSYNKLSSELKISEQDTRQINFIGMTTLNNDPIDNNDTSTKFFQPFKLVAHLTKTELTDTFQNALLNYFNNKTNIKRLKEDQIIFYNEKLLFIEKELAKLDSLKTEYTRFLASSKISATFYNNAFDPSTIYIQSDKLITEKELVRTWLSTSAQAILVIDEFKQQATPQSASIKKSLLYGALIGLAICFFLGLYLNLYKKISKYSEA